MNDRLGIIFRFNAFLPGSSLQTYGSLFQMAIVCQVAFLDTTARVADSRPVVISGSPGPHAL